MQERWKKDFFIFFFFSQMGQFLASIWSQLVSPLCLYLPAINFFPSPQPPSVWSFLCMFALLCLLFLLGFLGGCRCAFFIFFFLPSIKMWVEPQGLQFITSYWHFWFPQISSYNIYVCVNIRLWERPNYINFVYTRKYHTRYSRSSPFSLSLLIFLMLCHCIYLLTISITTVVSGKLIFFIILKTRDLAFWFLLLVCFILHYSA